MKLRFITENCEVLELPMNVVDSVVLDGEHLTTEDLFLRNTDEAKCLVVYFSNNLLDYSGFYFEGYEEENENRDKNIKRLKGNDITWISIVDGDKQVNTMLKWETDAILNSFQYTRLQKVIEENGKFAFIHNETEIDMDYFFPEDEELE